MTKLEQINKGEAESITHLKLICKQEIDNKRLVEILLALKDGCCPNLRSVYFSCNDAIRPKNLQKLLEAFEEGYLPNIVYFNFDYIPFGPYLDIRIRDLLSKIKATVICNHNAKNELKKHNNYLEYLHNPEVLRDQIIEVSEFCQRYINLEQSFCLLIKPLFESPPSGPLQRLFAFLFTSKNSDSQKYTNTIISVIQQLPDESIMVVEKIINHNFQQLPIKEMFHLYEIATFEQQDDERQLLKEDIKKMQQNEIFASWCLKVAKFQIILQHLYDNIPEEFAGKKIAEFYKRSIKDALEQATEALDRYRVEEEPKQLANFLEVEMPEDMELNGEEFDDEYEGL